METEDKPLRSSEGRSCDGRGKITVILALAAIVAFGAWFVYRHVTAKSAGGTMQTEQLYTCGMHPQVIQNHPGNCPICGMKLTPIRKQVSAGETSAASADSSAIAIDPVTTQNMGIRTGIVTKGPLRRVIRTVGTVDFNESALADVTTKFKGWIEKLYVDATGRLVKRGEPLFEIYSPELYSAQVEYVIALGGASAADKSSEALLRSARLRLKFFDISDDQIAELEKTREPKKTVRVNAPIDGFVTEKIVVEGMMVDAGTKLYRLADLSIVWVYAEIYEQDLPFVQPGQEALVSLSYLPDRQFRGRVTYVYPTVDEKTRAVRARLEFNNPGYLLKPGMFASVELRAELEPSVLLVPDMAVLRSGEKNTVFVTLDGGRFEPRTVALGARAENDMYQVLNGLKEGERVVTSGQFMLDSESQLREAIQKMLHPGDAVPVGGNSQSMPPDAAHDAAVPVPYPLYTCPMEEHADVVSDKPGQCPKCDMELVETTKVKHAKLAEENWRKQHPVTVPKPDQHKH